MSHDELRVLCRIYLEDGLLSVEDKIRVMQGCLALLDEVGQLRKDVDFWQRQRQVLARQVMDRQRKANE